MCDDKLNPSDRHEASSMKTTLAILCGPVTAKLCDLAI